MSFHTELLIISNYSWEFCIVEQYSWVGWVEGVEPGQLSMLMAKQNRPEIIFGNKVAIQGVGFTCLRVHGAMFPCEVFSQCSSEPSQKR